MQENNFEAMDNAVDVTPDPVNSERGSERGGQYRGRNDERGGRDRRGRNPRNNRRRDREEKKDPFREEVIHIGRVAKTVKGGRNYRFTALVVVGDGEGHVGHGLGKAAEVPDAIRKGSEAARKNMIKIPLKGTTIPHETLGIYGGGKVLMKPAPEGTGVIAGGPVRAVCDMAGIKDIRTKSLGSNNPKNMVEAVFAGLEDLSSLEEVARKRGKTIQEIIG